MLRSAKTLQFTNTRIREQYSGPGVDAVPCTRYYEASTILCSHSWRQTHLQDSTAPLVPPDRLATGQRTPRQIHKGCHWRPRKDMAASQTILDPIHISAINNEPRRPADGNYLKRSNDGGIVHLCDGPLCKHCMVIGKTAIFTGREEGHQESNDE